jgi:Protein of unknown function (DUF3303)
MFANDGPHPASSPLCAKENFAMLFMVIERFKNKDPKPIGERFKRLGRMLPDGVTYHASWIDPVEARCFQVMAADGIEELKRWAARWVDLADFEIVPVLSSQQYWAQQELEKNRSG